MRKRVFAVLMMMSLLIIGGLIYTQGIFASNSDTVVSKVGVQVFRIEDVTTKDGADAPDHPMIRGATSVLKRTADGVSMELNTSALPEGTYSIWWIIDNDNDDTTGASPVPPQVEGVEIVRIATGGIVGANGVGKFSATLAAAEVPPKNGATIGLNFDGNQVLNPMTARIALVMRFHGPVVPGGVIEQTTLFSGGCNNDLLVGSAGAGFPGVPPGDFTCYDPQITEFHVMEP